MREAGVDNGMTQKIRDMTKEELLQKLTEIEWDDFECKAAQDKLPEDVWATASTRCWLGSD